MCAECARCAWGGRLTEGVLEERFGKVDPGGWKGGWGAGSGGYEPGAGPLGAGSRVVDGPCPGLRSKGGHGVRTRACTYRVRARIRHTVRRPVHNAGDMGRCGLAAPHGGWSRAPFPTPARTCRCSSHVRRICRASRSVPTGSSTRRCTGARGSRTTTVSSTPAMSRCASRLVRCRRAAPRPQGSIGMAVHRRRRGGGTAPGPTRKRWTKTAAWWTFTEGKGREGQRMAIGQWAPPAADENTRPWLLAKTPPQLSAHKSVLESANPRMDSECASGCPRSMARATAPSPGRPTPGVVKQDKSSGGSVDTTKTRSGPRRVRMSSGERPIGAAKGTQPNTAAFSPPPPRPKAWEKTKVTIGKIWSGRLWYPIVWVPDRLGHPCTACRRSAQAVHNVARGADAMTQSEGWGSPAPPTLFHGSVYPSHCRVRRRDTTRRSHDDALPTRRDATPSATPRRVVTRLFGRRPHLRPQLRAHATHRCLFWGPSTSCGKVRGSNGP